jgi:IS30 family transposase
LKFLYRPEQAHKKVLARRKKARRPSKWTALVVYFVEKLLREELGQEQV